LCCPAHKPYVVRTEMFMYEYEEDVSYECASDLSEATGCMTCADSATECITSGNEGSSWVVYSVCPYGVGNWTYFAQDIYGNPIENCDIGYQRQCKEPNKCTYEPQDGETFSLDLCLKKGTVEVDTCDPKWNEDEEYWEEYTFGGWSCSGTTCSRGCVKMY